MKACTKRETQSEKHHKSIKCNPFQKFWKEDIEMAEERISEYNEILLNENKEE